MHAPKDYQCPFCAIVAGDSERKRDVIFENDDIIAFVALRQKANNLGHGLVVPKKHYENLYEIPDDLLAKVYIGVKKLAIATKKAYRSDGITTRQHNEPGGGQDVWHFHVHVYPRYRGDRFYEDYDNIVATGMPERTESAKKLRAALSVD
jgi:histidine triad (HIT) family protein